MISKAHCITLITYRIRRHRLNNDIHSITSSIIHLSIRTSSLLLPHRSIFDITMIFVDASIKMYIYTNKTTLREIDGDRVHSFCRSEAFYFSNILPHPFLVPPIIFPPWITNPCFPQIFLLVSKRFTFLNSDIKIIPPSFPRDFRSKNPHPVRDLLRSCQIFSDAPTFKREGANDASFQASQLENFVVHNYPSDPPPRRVCNLSLFSDALCMCSTPRCKWCTRK